MTAALSGEISMDRAAWSIRRLQKASCMLVVLSGRKAEKTILLCSRVLFVRMRMGGVFLKFQWRQPDFLFKDVTEILCIGEPCGVADLEDLHVCLQEQLFGALDARKLQVIAEADALFLMEQTAERDLGQADMVADETVCASGDPEELMGFLSEVGHPVLGMDPLDL